MEGNRFEGLAMTGERQDCTVNIVKYSFLDISDVSIPLLDRDETDFEEIRPLGT